MMDERTKEILKTVSDWDGEPEEGVAYNIRENGQCAGRQSSPHISIESKAVSYTHLTLPTIRLV